MARLRPGWLVTAFAAALSVSCWLPWLTTSADGGGRGSAIGGAVGSIVLAPRFGAGQLITLLSSVLIVLGAMAARDISARLAAGAAVALSLLVGILTWFFYSANVRPPVGAGYGLFLAVAFTAGVLGCSAWALATAVRGG